MSFDGLDDRLTWDYLTHQGPWCTEHRSSQCEHCIEAIVQRADAPYIEKYIDEAIPLGGNKPVLNLTVPLWTEFFMWETFAFEINDHPVFGHYGKLRSRGKDATFDGGLERLMRGESAMDLHTTLIQQFADMMELDPPTRLPGCKSMMHGMSYQFQLNKLFEKPNDPALTPHLYGLLGRGVCAFCWADTWGADARRVNPNYKGPVVTNDDFADLLPDAGMGQGRRSNS